MSSAYGSMSEHEMYLVGFDDTLCEASGDPGHKWTEEEAGWIWAPLVAPHLTPLPGYDDALCERSGDPNHRWTAEERGLAPVYPDIEYRGMNNKFKCLFFQMANRLRVRVEAAESKGLLQKKPRCRVPAVLYCPRTMKLILPNGKVSMHTEWFPSKA